MEELNKEFLIKKCLCCEHIQQKRKSLSFKDKPWSISCSYNNNNKMHEVNNFEYTPRQCPFYLQRMLFSFNEGNDNVDKKN